jgi:hypothetical protein
MTRKSVTTGLAVLTMLIATTSPACAAVSKETQQACEAQADQVRPALRAPEREAFIANCLADATATTPKKKKSD